MILDCQILVSTEKGRAYSFSCHGNMTTCPNKLFYTIKSGIDLFFCVTILALRMHFFRTHCWHALCYTLTFIYVLYYQTRRSLDRGDGPGKIFPGLYSLASQNRALQPREQSNRPKQPIAQLFEQGTYSTLIIFLKIELGPICFTWS
jgi:hypothetical protein